MIPHRQARTIRYGMRAPPRIEFPHRKVWSSVAALLMAALALGAFGLVAYIQAPLNA